jgi:hypothetical protein
MPVENVWLVQDRIIVTRLSGTVTAEEMIVSSHQGTSMIEAGIEPVYSLVDMTNILHFPLKLTDLNSIFARGTSPKLRWIVIYGIPNRLASFLATMFSQLIRINFRVVKDEAEALTLINQYEHHPLRVD